MIDQSTCMGCYFTPNFLQYANHWPVPFNLPVDYKLQTDYKVQVTSLTQDEIVLLRNLAETWNLFCNLDKRLESDNKEFLDCVHRMQQIVAMRVARRANPEVWRQSDEEKV